MRLWRMESPECGVSPAMSLVGDGVGRSAEQIWDDEEWCEKVVEFIAWDGGSRVSVRRICVEEGRDWPVRLRVATWDDLGAAVHRHSLVRLIVINYSFKKKIHLLVEYSHEPLLFPLPQVQVLQRHSHSYVVQKSTTLDQSTESMIRGIVLQLTIAL